MDPSRALVASAACAVFVIALAGVQLAVNAAGESTDRGEDVTGATRIVSEESPAKRDARHHFVTEDMAGWDCASMGNRQCAPEDTRGDGVFPGSSDPRPLKMAGVEIHKRECPKGRGAEARVKLMKRSAIYGHCTKPGSAEKSEPREPREPSTSHGKN